MSMETDKTVTSDIKQLVVFGLAGEQYGIDIHMVQEIIRMQDITKVPKTHSFVEGVISLRGKVIPVIDLRKRFGLEVTESGAETRIIVIEMNGLVIGMVVDVVSEVLRIPEASIEPPSPIVANIDSDFIQGVGKLNERLIILLDPMKILNTQEQEHINAVASRVEGRVSESNAQ